MLLQKYLKLAGFFACSLYVWVHALYFSPLVAKAAEPAPTVAQLQEQIRGLLIVLQQLQMQVNAKRSVSPVSAPPPIIDASSPIILRGFIPTFPHDLSYGMQNNQEVIQLQRFLKIQGYGPSEEMPDEDAPGSYLAATREAVKQFQKDNKLPPTGYFGPLTRKLVNNMVTAN